MTHTQHTHYSPLFLSRCVRVVTVVAAWSRPRRDCFNLYLYIVSLFFNLAKNPGRNLNFLAGMLSFIDESMFRQVVHVTVLFTLSLLAETGRAAA